MSIYSSNKKNRQQNRKIRTEAKKWFKSLICEYDFGTKWIDPLDDKVKVPRANKTDKIEQKLQGKLPAFEHLKTLTFKKLQDHLDRRQTFYYCSRGYDRRRKKSSDYILVMIDIDVLKCLMKGSPEGGRTFAAYLKEHYFRNLYIEVSTGGNGTHCYFLLQVGDLPNEIVNDYCRQLEDYLKFVAQTIGADIEDVEIKGRCPELSWKAGQIVGFKHGQLAKIPHGLEDRFAELKNTAVVQPEQITAWLSEVPPNAKKVRKKSGSSGSTLFNESEVDGLKAGGFFHKLAVTCFNGRDSISSGHRTKTLPEDLAIVLMMGEFCTKNMNPDGTLPTARLKALHKSLYEAGDVSRQYDCHRFVACRDLLSSMGLLVEEDERFTPPLVIDGEVQAKGEAAKWRFSPKLIDLIAEARSAVTEIEVEVTVGPAAEDHPEQILGQVKVSLGGTREKRPFEEDPNSQIFKPRRVNDPSMFQQWQNDRLLKQMRYYERLEEALEQMAA